MGTEKIEKKRNIEKIDRNPVVVLILFKSYDSHDILGNFASKLYNKDNFFSFFLLKKYWSNKYNVPGLKPEKYIKIQISQPV